mgnify:CR=1 FL=1
MKKLKNLDLEIGDLVVYPIYGVGEIEEFDSHKIDGDRHDFILINFSTDAVFNDEKKDFYGKITKKISEQRKTTNAN